MPASRPAPTASDTQSSDVSTRIVRSAERLFRRMGYAKTAVADIAREAGISTAYVYRFYPSKMAICQAVCTGLMARLTDVLWHDVRSTLDPETKVRRIYVRLMEEAVRAQAEEERLTEMVQASMAENWESVDAFRATLLAVSHAVIEEGVGDGTFQVADVDAAAHAMAATLLLCSHPVMVQEAVLGDPAARAKAIAQLVVGGLTAKHGE